MGFEPHDCLRESRRRLDRSFNEPKLAERQGFEPWVLFLTVRRFSKPLLSASQAPLR